MRSLYLILLSLFFSFNSFSQKEVFLHLHHLLGEAAFQMDSVSHNDMGNAFTLQRLEYYISEIRLIHDNGNIIEIDKYYILANGSIDSSYSLGIYDIENLEAIHFSVGVDETANHSDPSSYDASHPLSPKFPSMHWGWAAGYRFVALEGKTGDNFLLDFQVHALGDQNYFETIIETTGDELPDGSIEINIDADYTKAISGINISQGLVVHGDYGAAIDVMKNFNEHVFTASEGQTTSTINEEQLQFNVLPNPNRGVFYLDGLNNSIDPKRDISIMDNLGRNVPGKFYRENNRMRIELPNSGIYFISVRYGKNAKTHIVQSF